MDEPCPQTVRTAFGILNCKAPLTKREWFEIRRDFPYEMHWLNRIRACIRQGLHHEFHILYDAIAVVLDWAEDFFYREQLFLLYLCHKTQVEPETAWENHDRDFKVRGIHKVDIQLWAKSIL